MLGSCEARRRGCAPGARPGRSRAARPWRRLRDTRAPPARRRGRRRGGGTGARRTPRRRPASGARSLRTAECAEDTEFEMKVHASIVGVEARLDRSLNRWFTRPVHFVASLRRSIDRSIRLVRRLRRVGRRCACCGEAFRLHVGVDDGQTNKGDADEVQPAPTAGLDRRHLRHGDPQRLPLDEHAGELQDRDLSGGGARGGQRRLHVRPRRRRRSHLRRRRATRAFDYTLARTR